MQRINNETILDTVYDLADAAGLRIDEFMRRVEETFGSKEASLDGLPEEVAQELIAARESKKQLARDRREKERESANSAEIRSFREIFPDVSADDIPEEVWDDVANGATLSHAYALYAARQSRLDDYAAGVNRRNGETSAAVGDPAAEQEIKDELEGKTVEAAENQAKEDAVKSFQVVSGDMFSRVHEPVIRITTKGITFNKSCVSKLPDAENVELLFNPVERMMVIRPCRPDHPNAIPWDAKYKSAAPLCKVLYDSMGWETDYAFRVPCQAIKNPNAAVLGDTVLVFDLDNYVGRAMSKKDEVIIARKEAAANTEEREDAKSYYYPPDEDEPQEIRDMEEKFQQAVEVNKKLFGTPAFQHDSGVRGLSAKSSDEEWDMMVEARPLDITHTVDAGTVDDLLLEIMDDPPVLPQSQEAYPVEPIVVEPMGEEE